MTLKETLIKKFGSIRNAAKELGYSHDSELFNQLKRDNQRKSTLKEITAKTKGLKGVIEAGKETWTLKS